MNTVQIPLNEYQLMQEELTLLRNTDLLTKMNRLVDILFQEKYGLFMQDYTEDLTEYSLNNSWEKEDTDVWDNL
jgi:chloramphenicol O-acetyltransferase